MEGKLIKSEYHTYILEDSNGNLVGSISDNGSIDKLSLKNCEAIANGYDLEELACDKIGIDISVVKHIDNKLESHSSPCIPLNEGGCLGAGLYHMVKGFEIGFQKGLEILSDKKFSEFLDKEKELGISDIKTIERIQWYYKTYFDKSQQNEWLVEIEMEKEVGTKLHDDGREFFWTDGTKPKLDADGCLILRRC